jgi:hypothetical protein
LLLSVRLLVDTAVKGRSAKRRDILTPQKKAAKSVLAAY